MASALSRSSSSSSSSRASHDACKPGTCGFYKQLSHYLPSYPRSVTLGYLETERVTCFPSCTVLSAPSLPPHIETSLGWKPWQCSEEAIRDLIKEKMLSVVAHASQRSSAYKTNLSALACGFWYANEYYDCLKEKGQQARIDYLKKGNAFYHGLPPKGFSLVPEAQWAAGFRLNSYRLDRGTLPAKGLGNVRDTLCMIDCQEAIELAYYEALLEILGNDKFNHFFRAEGGHPLSFDCDLVKTPLSQFMVPNISSNSGILGTRPIKSGDCVYFKNLPLYGTKHPDGDWMGFHMICTQDTGPQKFIGFGASPEAITEDQILELFVEEFNKTPKSRSSIYTSELIRALDQSEAASPDPEGISKEDLKARAARIQISKKTIEVTKRDHPESVGFIHNYVWSPNIEFIRAILAS